MLLLLLSIVVLLLDHVHLLLTHVIRLSRLLNYALSVIIGARAEVFHAPDELLMLTFDLVHEVLHVRRFNPSHAFLVLTATVPVVGQRVHAPHKLVNCWLRRGHDLRVIRDVHQAD